MAHHGLSGQTSDSQDIKTDEMSITTIFTEKGLSRNLLSNENGVEREDLHLCAAS